MATTENCECLDKWQYLCAASIQKSNGKTLVQRFSKLQKPEQLVANEVTSKFISIFSFENSTLTKAKKCSFKGGKFSKKSSV